MSLLQFHTLFFISFELLSILLIIINYKGEIMGKDSEFYKNKNKNKNEDNKLWILSFPFLCFHIKV